MVQRAEDTNYHEFHQVLYAEKASATRMQQCIFTKFTTVGPCRQIESSAGTSRYLSRNFRKNGVGAEFAKVLRAFQGGKKVFIVDTEFLPKTLIELCVLDHKGKPIMNSFVNHADRSWAEITKNMTWHGRGLLARFQFYNGGPPKEESEDAAEIFRALKKHGMSKDSIWIEHSTSYCDYSHVKRYLEEEGMEDILPAMENRFSSVLPLRRLLPGFWGFGLQNVMNMVLPEHPATLKPAHRARADAEKLFAILEWMLMFAKVT